MRKCVCPGRRERGIPRLLSSPYLSQTASQGPGASLPSWVSWVQSVAATHAWEQEVGEESAIAVWRSGVTELCMCLWQGIRSTHTNIKSEGELVVRGREWYYFVTTSLSLLCWTAFRVCYGSVLKTAPCQVFCLQCSKILCWTTECISPNFVDNIIWTLVLVCRKKTVWGRGILS